MNDIITLDGTVPVEQRESNPGTTRATSPTVIAHWVQEICRRYAQGQGPAGVLALANVVLQARNSLRRHGQWSRLWRQRSMPYCKREADVLVFISKGLSALNEQDLAHLPRRLTSLELLAKLDIAAILQEIQKDTIHPRLTFRQTKALVDQLKGVPQNTNTRQAVLRRTKNYSQFLLDNLDTCSMEELVQVEGMLAQSLDRVRNHLAGKAHNIIALDCAPDCQTASST